MLDLQISHVRKTFPNLPAQALNFFSIENAIKSPQGTAAHSLHDFCVEVGIPTSETSKTLPPINTVRLLLNRLVDAGLLLQISRDQGPFGMEDRYFYIKTPDEKELHKKIADFIAYGVPAVVEAYGTSTFQLISRIGENPRAGTAFVMTPNCILTAAHCVRNAEELQICGLAKSELAGAEVVVSRSETLDCAAIILKNDALDRYQKPIIAQAEVTDDVVLLGYPNIPTLLNIRVAEKASIATVIQGAVASHASDIFKSDLLLITAPVRGGFSGGPVITHSGFLLGMISRQPFPELTQTELQKYDAAGFGLAVPVAEIKRFMDAVKAQDTEIVERRLPSSFEWVE